MNGRPLVRMLLASAATAAAIVLAGCDTESALTKSTLRAKQPLSPKILAEIDNKNMVKETPILIRIFKEEAELEVWKQTREGRYALLKTYPICRWSGELGPKIKEGDRQAPEGFYTITPGQLNPNSSYYLAFNTGYPNAFDRAHGRTGSELMVHGDCSSRGCYAMTDEQMGEIYALAREAFFGGQKSFQLQAYPFRMTPVNMARHRANPNMPFWRMLKEGYDHFEVTRLEPKVDVCERHYVFDAEASASFSPAGKCPTYHVPGDIMAAVREKQHRDALRTAELINFTPVAPIKTGTDGGMNKVYLAAISSPNLAAGRSEGTTVHALAATPHGTIPNHINPPRPSQPVYASKQAEADSARLMLASVQSAPEDTGSSGGGFFSAVSQALGGSELSDEKQQVLVGRARPIATAARETAKPSREPAPVLEPKPQVAAVPAAKPAQQHQAPHRAEPTAVVARHVPLPPTTVAEARPNRPKPGAPKPALRGTSDSPTARRTAAKPSAWGTPAPTASLSSPSTMTSLAGPVIRGSQPALRAGSFDHRWSALR